MIGILSRKMSYCNKSLNQSECLKKKMLDAKISLLCQEFSLKSTEKK